MKSLSHQVINEPGLHARTAGLITKKLGSFQSEMLLSAHGKSVNPKQLFWLMSLNVKKGDSVTLRIEGPDEEEAYQAAKALFEENL